MSHEPFDSNGKPKRAKKRPRGKRKVSASKKVNVNVGDPSWLDIAVKITRVVGDVARIHDFMVKIFASDDG